MADSIPTKTGTPAVIRAVLVVALFLVIILIPLRYAYNQQARLRNFRVVEPGVLYRSGQLTSNGLRNLVRELGIRTVVNFRAEETGPQKDVEEEALCKELGLNYERVVYRTWSSDSGPPQAEKSVNEYFAIMDRYKNKGPMLVHCFAGKHRTGAFVALYRMEYQGWSNAEALTEMQAVGYEGIANEDDVRGYLERYVPRNKRKAIEK
ncbi:MAG: dual specificity protein phosphatase family protein [Gemmataceae bacterium]